MKKVLFTIALVLLPMLASAAVEIDGIYYNLHSDAKTAEVTRNPNSYKGDVTIPETFVYAEETYSVTAIGEYAFAAAWQLTSVIIGNNVISIGNGAFSGNGSLTSVTIGNNVISIGEMAFYGTRITSIVIPNSVTDIGEGAFWANWDMTSVTIGNGVTSIGKRAFYGTRLTSITIPGSVIYIGELAFSDNLGLTSITVDESNTVYRSEDGVLMTKDGTELLVYPAAKTGTAYTIPDGVTSIADGAFMLCDGLTSITIPGSVTSIGMSAFSCCTGLTSITIPSSVTSIGDGAFGQCTGLTSVTIPSSVTSIGDGAFSWCSSLTSIIVDGANTKYKSVDGVLMSKYGSTLLVYPAGKAATSYAIPNGVTTISREAFGYCVNLTSITIPGSVTSIGVSAFLEIEGLKDIYCLAENVPNMPSDNVFLEVVFESATLHVPAGSIDEYKNDDPWNPWRFKTIVALKDSEMANANFDLNHDGVVNAADVVMLINFIAGMQTE